MVQQTAPRPPDISSVIAVKLVRIAFGYRRFRCLKSSRSSALKLSYGFSVAALQNEERR
jgi:hypothetical protein